MEDPVDAVDPLDLTQNWPDVQMMNLYADKPELAGQCITVLDARRPGLENARRYTMCREFLCHLLLTDADSYLAGLKKFGRALDKPWTVVLKHAEGIAGNGWDAIQDKLVAQCERNNNTPDLCRVLMQDGRFQKKRVEHQGPKPQHVPVGATVRPDEDYAESGVETKATRDYHSAQSKHRDQGDMQDPGLWRAGQHREREIQERAATKRKPRAGLAAITRAARDKECEKKRDLGLDEECEWAFRQLNEGKVDYVRLYNDPKMACLKVNLDKWKKRLSRYRFNQLRAMVRQNKDADMEEAEEAEINAQEGIEPKIEPRIEKRSRANKEAAAVLAAKAKKQERFVEAGKRPRASAKPRDEALAEGKRPRASAKPRDEASAEGKRPRASAKPRDEASAEGKRPRASAKQKKPGASPMAKARKKDTPMAAPKAKAMPKRKSKAMPKRKSNLLQIWPDISLPADEMDSEPARLAAEES